MKKEIIWIIIGIIIVVSVLILCFHPKAKSISSIKKLRFHYTVGYAMNAYVTYELICDDDCFLSYKLNGVSEEDTKKVPFPKKDISKIVDVLNKYNVSSWDGFDKNNKNVLDGDSFSFSLDMGNNEEIYASGYMMWPKNYREVKTELEAIFNTVIN